MTKRKEIRLPNRRYPRYVVRSVTGFPISESRGAWGGRKKPSTVWYVLDRWFAFTIVFITRREYLARRRAKRWNAEPEPKKKWEPSAATKAYRSFRPWEP